MDLGFTKYTWVVLSVVSAIKAGIYPNISNKEIMTAKEKSEEK